MQRVSPAQAADAGQAFPTASIARGPFPWPLGSCTGRILGCGSVRRPIAHGWLSIEQQCGMCGTVSRQSTLGCCDKKIHLKPAGSGQACGLMWLLPLMFSEWPALAFTTSGVATSACARCRHRPRLPHGCVPAASNGLLLASRPSSRVSTMPGGIAVALAHKPAPAACALIVAAGCCIADSAAASMPRSRGHQSTDDVCVRSGSPSGRGPWRCGGALAEVHLRCGTTGRISTAATPGNYSPRP